MNQLLIVLRKELRDAIRDRRSVLSALIYPVITPLILVFVFQMAADEAKNPPPMRLAIAGMEHAPGLVEELKANEVELEGLDRAVVTAGVQIELLADDFERAVDDRREPAATRVAIALAGFTAGDPRDNAVLEERLEQVGVARDVL